MKRQTKIAGMITFVVAGCGGAAVEAPPCSITGRWVMTSVFCGPNDVTADVRAAGGITEMRLDISDDSGSCHMVGTFTGPDCIEVEQRGFTIDGSGQLTQTDALGITSCEPAGCSFNANDAPCMIGDRAGGPGLTSAELDDATIVVTNRPPSGLCQRFGLDTITSYARP